MRRVIFISTIILLLFGCGTQKQMKGNVYTLSSGNKNTDVGSDLILGLRIDDVRNDTLLIKYKIGNEIFLDADFVYDAQIECYCSTDMVLRGIVAGKKSLACISFDGQKRLLMELSDSTGSKTVEYQKIYKMKVDLLTHRNGYYAEDGFSLQISQKQL